MKQRVAQGFQFTGESQAFAEGWENEDSFLQQVIKIKGGSCSVGNFVVNFSKSNFFTRGIS